MKSAKTRLKKKSKRQRAINRCDKLWSGIIRSKGYCEASEVSECLGILQACHIGRRGDNAIRHDLENGLCLCVKHHYWFDKGDKWETTQWFDKKFPGRKERLHKKNIIVFYKTNDFEDIEKKLMEVK